MASLHLHSLRFLSRTHRTHVPVFKSQTLGSKGITKLAAEEGCRRCRDLLGLGEGPVQEKEVRSAYRLAARKLHPDRGGKQAEFQDLQRCYEELLAEAKQQTSHGKDPEWLAQMKKDFATSTLGC
eukprot:TRINITY_DN15959_c0_g3_i1.p1 TRINITY_DN15959_c0_g3~~TRINITY_DN15959_c0_g3_i1.p1  ORF type:complete len:141 (-),score=24.60 TRINITY_DN15959_c0_g3_i1:99-473(-)